MSNVKNGAISPRTASSSSSSVAVRRKSKKGEKIPHRSKSPDSTTSHSSNSSHINNNNNNHNHTDTISNGGTLPKLNGPIRYRTPSIADLFEISPKVLISDPATQAARVAESLRQNDMVVLDVGGVKFKTTISTLTKFSNTFFASLFSGQYEIPKQEDGSVFVDRDGVHFRRILNFMRCGTIIWPQDPQSRRELLLEANFYGLDRLILQQEEAEEPSEEPDDTVWQSNVIFVGSQNIDAHSPDINERRAFNALSHVQCPLTSEMVWKSIHDTGLTVIFQIINDENSDFSLAGLARVLSLLERWRRDRLRFVLVYDAELIRELLKLSGEPFNNSSYIWYFAKGRLIDCGVQWKLRYVSENIWKHYYLGALQEK